MIIKIAKQSYSIIIRFIKLPLNKLMIIVAALRAEFWKNWRENTMLPIMKIVTKYVKPNKILKKSS